MGRAQILVPVLVLLAGCGGFIAVSPEHPLGEFEEIDRYLVEERPFKKSEDRFRHNECFDDEDLLMRFEEAKVIKYLEVGKGTVAGEIHVKVVLDNAGKVVALVGRFHSRTGIWSDAGGKTETFCSDRTDNDGDSKIDCSDLDCNGKACGFGCICQGCAVLHIYSFFIR